MTLSCFLGYFKLLTDKVNIASISGCDNLIQSLVQFTVLGPLFQLSPS